MDILKKVSWVFVGLFFTVSSVIGGEFPNLYVASVPLTTTFSSIDDATFRKGLEEILIRTTGNSDVSKIVDIQNQTKDIHKFIRRYWVENQNVFIEFDEQFILDVLIGARQPILGPYRPVVLLWLVENNRITHQLITEEDESISVLISSLKLSMKSRGIILKIPLNNDSADNFLEPLDIWKVSKEKIEKASKQYHYDVLLVGKVMKTGINVLSSEWQTLFLNPKLKWQRQGGDIENLTQEVADILLQFLSRSLVFTPDKKQSNLVKIRIMGVNTIQDFSEVYKKLLPFRTILSFDQIGVFPTEIEFHVTTNVDKNILKRNIALHHAFALEESPLSDNLNYQWVPSCSKGC